MNQIEFRGSKWYKCDLHLHTVASKCFQDQSITAKQWVNRAIEQGLNCVAVTDHNTGISVDTIKNAAEDTNLIVFPGVEITCDTSKIHLLIIFDVNKSSSDIRDFLVRADIRAEDFGTQTAATSKSIFEIAELAQRDGGIVIPAHIDEYNGLESVSVANLEKLYTEFNIKAVQVVHSDFLDSSFNTTNNLGIKEKLNEYYGNPTPPIEETTIKNWYTPVKIAKDKNLAILTFSDNPHELKNSKHGLWGIGQRFTWIKMDEEVNLESLRQAFLLHELRIKNDFNSDPIPYKLPNLWIKSLSITNITITESDIPFKINFNPQMNTIIGGRGSGKSSILRILRGLFNKTIDLSDLKELLDDHNSFYKKESGRPKKGILKDDTILEVEIIRNSDLHKITATNIINSSSQTIKIEKLNQDGVWEEITDDSYIDFFEFEHYSQKQIYEIAQEPNALRERIDNAIPEIKTIKIEREIAKKQFLEKSAAIRTSDSILANKGKVETKIKDIELNIQKLKESGISELIETNQNFINQKKQLLDFYQLIQEKEKLLENVLEDFIIDDIELQNYKKEYTLEISESTEKVVKGISKVKENIVKLKEDIINLKEKFIEDINNSLWKTEEIQNASQLKSKKEELQANGLDIINNFEKYNKEKSDLEKQLSDIVIQSSARVKEIEDKEKYLNEYKILTKEITAKRREFLNEIVTGDKVKVSIKPFRNRSEFESKIRKLFQREGDTYQTDIDKLLDLSFNGNVENKIQEFRETILKVRNGGNNVLALSGHFINFVKTMNDAQIDELQIILPEDEIEIQYKPTSSAAFKSLSTASAGQKTTAILTFILSYGNLPLILDQPEDDLDNRLVYELIVDRLKIAKDKRQLIIVTHNANIPVNGDSELIISMNSESKYLNLLYEGTVDKNYIKKEICDVMEGGETAFEMRSLRYRR